MHAESLTINRDDPHSQRMRDEFLAIAEDFLERSDLPAEARYWCARWHERESAHCAAQLLFAGRGRAALGYARRGLGRSWRWPILLARQVGGALLTRFKI